MANYIGTHDFSNATVLGLSAAATFERTYTGAVATGKLVPIVIPKDLDGLSIKEVRVSLSGRPSDQAVKVDVRKNGTATTNSILTSDAEVQLGTSEVVTNGLYQSGCDVNGATIGSPSTSLDSANVVVAANDVLWIYITQTGNGAGDLVVTLTVS